MRIDFNIVCIDDQPALLRAQMVALERKLNAKGFCLKIAYANAVSTALQSYINNTIYKDNIDLIIIDYDLGHGVTGDSAIEEIRNQDGFHFRDVVFYSANVEPLQNAVAQKKLQGIYCSSRIDLVDDLFSVFENLERKVLDIDHSRGIFMGATAEVDHVISECLSAATRTFSEESKNKAIKWLKEKLDEKLIKLSAARSALESATTIDHSIIGQHEIVTADNRINLLRKLLEFQGSGLEHETHLLKYTTTIVPFRNKLAHVRSVIIEGFTRKLYATVGGEETEITPDVMQEHRHILVELRREFDSLVKILGVA